MDTIKRKITKEEYDCLVKGGLTMKEKAKIFGDSIVYGYGLYGYTPCEKDGNYTVTFCCGSSCD